MKIRANCLVWVAVVGTLLGMSTTASAGVVGNYLENLWSGTTFSGHFQYNLAVRTTGSQNHYNQGSLPLRNVAVPRQAYLPPALSAGVSNFTAPIPGFSDTYKRGDFIPSRDLPFSDNQLRLNGHLNVPLAQGLSFIAELRAVYQPTLFSNRYEASAVTSQGGIPQGEYWRGADMQADYFDFRGRYGKRIMPLELSSTKYMVDLPTLVMEWRHGSLDLRVGNQVIAWGQSIFLRTLDVANGLDYRRHLILDRAIEEYQDKRVPAPTLRITDQMTTNILFDGFVERFEPTIIPNMNTPYNVIPSHFYQPLDNYFSGGYDSKLSYGFRLKADYGNWGWTLMAARRYNPNGVYSWARSGINKPLPNTGLGGLVNTAYAAKVLNPAGCGTNHLTCRQFADTGAAFASSPLTVAPGGVSSGAEWFSAASSAHLKSVDAFNALISQYPGLQDMYATTQSTVAGTVRELNTFLIAAGGSIRGTVQRDYHAENIFGGGLKYITQSSNQWLNAIIVNLEATYTPKEILTSPGLWHGGLSTDEYVIGLTAEKWTRWSYKYPSAYLVLEYQHRSASDLVGLSLEGYGGTPTDSSDPRMSPGISGANYVVFAGFQPSPNKLFTFEWAFLWDVRGGLLAQPNIRYEPGYNLHFDLFYNYVNGSLYGTPTNNVVSDISYADEVTLRVTYDF